MALAIPNELERLRDGAKRFVDEFTVGQKTIVGIAFVAVIVAAVVFLHYSSQPTFAPLFTNLTAADASSITQKLTANKIPFQVADNGATVEVPQNDVYSQRIAMAQANLPNQTTNVGLSKVDKEGITTSSFQQTVDFQQGLQGELQSTIEAISGVQVAQVNLVLPSDNPLVLNNSPTPSAAVLVTMQPGQSLSSGQVQAIVHLVASSAPGLVPDSVTVTDAAGDLLAGPGVQQNSFDSQDKQTQLYESGVEQEVGKLLSTVVGPNNTDVVDNVTLNFDKTSQVIKGLQQNPDLTVVASPNQSNCQNSNYSGSAPPPGGTAGALTTPTGSATAGNTLNNNGCQQNFTLGTYTKSIDTAPGAVVQETLTAVVNQNALPKNVQIRQLDQLVQTAANLQPARGDVWTVEALPFSNAAAIAQAHAQALSSAQARHNEIMTAVRVAAVLAVIAIILLFMHRAARKPEEIMPEDLPALEAGEEEFFEPEEELTMGEEEAMEAAGENPFDLDLAEGIPHELETSSIGEFIENQPDEVARLLRAWMQETKAPASPGSASRQPEQQLA